MTACLLCCMISTPQNNTVRHLLLLLLFLYKEIQTESREAQNVLKSSTGISDSKSNTASITLLSSQ